SLANEGYFRLPVSRTFHGRDIFAPVAAHLSCGVPIRKFGPAQKTFVRLEWPAPRPTRRGVKGQIIYLDRFGNAITNLDTASLIHSGDTQIQILVKGKWSCPLATHYGAVPAGKPVAVIGSSGFLAIAIHCASAVKRLRLRVGDPVEVVHNKNGINGG